MYAIFCPSGCMRVLTNIILEFSTLGLIPNAFAEYYVISLRNIKATSGLITGGKLTLAANQQQRFAGIHSTLSGLMN